MDKTPFSVYDFFAYLSSGAILLATGDYVMGYGLLSQKDVGLVLAVLLIILAYVGGHIVAHFSSFIFEYGAVGRILRRPSVVLLGEHASWRVWPWIFPNYFRALPEVTQKRVHQQAAARHFAGKGEALFLHAYPLVTFDSGLQNRLDSFRNQYGFARNMSFVFLASAIAVIAAHKLAYHPVRLRWAVLAGTAGVVLFYRYLKFLRQFSYELFLRYAELPRTLNTGPSEEV